MTTDNELIKVMKEAMEMLDARSIDGMDDAGYLLATAIEQHELDLKADEADYLRDQMKDRQAEKRMGER